MDHERDHASRWAAFAFDAVESGGVIRFQHRGGAPVATFDADDCVEGEADDAEAITLTRGQETDLPDLVTVAFTDVNRDYQPGTVSRARLAGYSDRVSNTGLALVMDEASAQTIADRMLPEAWIGRETAQLALPPSQIAIEPCDVIGLMVDGLTLPFLIRRILDAGSRKVDAVRVEAALYGPVLPGFNPPTLTIPPVFGPAVLAIMDLPLLSDIDLAQAPYVAAGASPWAGVTVMDSPTGTDFGVDTVVALSATIGVTVGTFARGPLDVWDFANVLTVTLGGGDLSSRTAEDILAARVNALAIQTGQDWEIIQFVTATLIGPGTYELRQLLRGRLGTEPAMAASLAAGAAVVVLDGAVTQLDVLLSERSISRVYRWGPSRLPPTDPSWQQTTFVPRCVGLMPWAPAQIAGARAAGGDLTITWVRRTRFAGGWADGTDVPLNEESERYEVDVMNGATVVRTIAATTPVAVYSASQQVADFGAVQVAVAVRVYQLSATVGRGRGGVGVV